MNEIALINDILNQIYSEPTFSYTKPNINKQTANTILLRLHSEGLADITIVNGLGEQVTSFSISSKARELIESLPDKYKGKPYTYHLKLQEEEKKKDEEKVELERRKLKLDIVNAERVAKSYPYTQFIAWVSFIVAIFLGFLKLAEVLKLWPYHK